MRIILFGVLGLAVLGCAFFLYPQTFVEAPHTIKPEKFFYIPTKKPDPIRIGFVGDVMLGRGVEVLMNKEGAEYPFLHIRPYLEAHDVLVGNFEGVVKEQHIHAPSMTFQFSIKESYLKMLKDVGFDVLSLGNNHSLDYGEKELRFTKERCVVYELLCGGYPNRIEDDSFATKVIGEEVVGFLFLSTVWGEPSFEDVEELIKKSVSSSTFQIAYIHWGDEYELVHNAQQEALAYMLIDGGIDVVIGHHPHVIQDIEIYKERPIFYSLGNFIFDQYFSEDVNEGLGVTLVLEKDVATYTLTSFRNDRGRSQPHQSEKTEHERLLSRILKPLEGMEGVEGAEGVITIERE